MSWLTALLQGLAALMGFLQKRQEQVAEDSDRAQGRTEQAAEDDKAALEDAKRTAIIKDEINAESDAAVRADLAKRSGLRGDHP